jgi:hypothetical protein
MDRVFLAYVLTHANPLHRATAAQILAELNAAREGVAPPWWPTSALDVAVYLRRARLRGVVIKESRGSFILCLADAEAVHAQLR